MKICARCKEELSESSFRWKNKEKTRLQSYCIECNKAVNKEHFQNNKEEYAKKRDLYRRDHRLRMRVLGYGLTVEQFQSLSDETNGICPICLVKPAINIDHCHSTGKVRGLLCKTCNLGLGSFYDSIENLNRAINYLQ